MFILDIMFCNEDMKSYMMSFYIKQQSCPNPDPPLKDGSVSRAFADWFEKTVNNKMEHVPPGKEGLSRAKLICYAGIQYKYGYGLFRRKKYIWDQKYMLTTVDERSI